MSHKNTVRQEIISEKTRKLMLYFHLVIAGRIVLVLALSPRGVIEIIFNWSVINYTESWEARAGNRIPAGQNREQERNQSSTYLLGELHYAGCIEKQLHNVALCQSVVSSHLSRINITGRCCLCSGEVRWGSRDTEIHTVVRCNLSQWWIRLVLSPWPPASPQSPLQLI